jgi:hypothetical protein
MRNVGLMRILVVDKCCRRGEGRKMSARNPSARTTGDNPILLSLQRSIGKPVLI